MASPSWLDDAAAYATCATLTATGTSLVGTGVATMWAGGSGLVPLSLGMLSLLGAGAACSNTPVDGTVDPPSINGCYVMEPGGSGYLQARSSSTAQWLGFPTTDAPPNVTEILETRLYYSDGLNKWINYIRWLRDDGSEGDSTAIQFPSEATAAAYEFRILPHTGNCAVEPGEPTPLPPNFTDPVQYTDSSTSCIYNISPQGFTQETEGGGAGIVFKIEAAGPQTLTGGGVVGGCNFEPTLVYQPPGGGPPTTIPWDPTWGPVPPGGIPPWLQALIAAAGGAVGASIANSIDKLFETVYPAGQKTIQAACEYKEDGTPETFTVTYPAENYQARVLTALDAQVDFMQQILKWKTPTCDCSPSPVTGDPVTINFESSEYSPFGNNRLRKRFVYFDQSGSTLEQTTDHWKDFVWQAGGVAVFCKGTALGKPQVWAATEEEAKRVINHAAAITGADMSNAEWITTTSKDPRYGVPGEMHVMRGKNGTFGITKRGKPSGLPPALG